MRRKVKYLGRKICCAQNVQKAGYAKIGIGVIAGAVALYCLAGIGLAAREAKRTQSELESVRTKLSDQSTQQRKYGQSSERRAMTDASFETLAVCLSNWSRENDVSLDSISPEGAPAEMEVKLDDSTNLGKWSVGKIHIHGMGNYHKVKTLFGCLRKTGMPLEMNSLTLQSVAGGSGKVTFDMLLTIYGASKGGSS